LAGTFQNAYATLGGRVIGRVDLPAKAPNFYFADQLGSTSVIVNAGGTITKDEDFYPYGGEMSVTNSDPNRYKFTGQERDAESGLDDFGARFHASALGRFTSPDPGWLIAADPTSPQSWNQYTYVLNNPLRYTDPLGLWCVWTDGTGHDDDPGDGGASEKECADQGGQWDSTDTTTYINENDDATGVSLESSIEVHADDPGPTYADCVKDSGNYFSAQHMLQSATDGKWGNGWFAGALLGNPVSDGIEFGQALAGGNAGDAASGGGAVATHTLTENGLEHAGENLIDKTYTRQVNLTIKSTLVDKGGTVWHFKMSTNKMVTKTTTIPLGTLGRGAKAGASVFKALNVWNYGVSFVSAGVCGIGH